MSEAEQIDRDAARYRYLALKAYFTGRLIELSFSSDISAIPACMPDVALGMAVDAAMEEVKK